MSHITAMIVDDHPFIRRGIRQLLERDARYEVVAEAACGYEAIQQAEIHQPGIILMDVQLQGLTGLLTVPMLKKRHPKSHVIILSAHLDDVHVYQAAMIGVAAYVAKDSAPDQLLATIARVVAGEHPIVEMLLERPAIASRVLTNLQRPVKERLRAAEGDRMALPMTMRELEVLDCILHGFTNRESADALFITEQTVKNHMTRLLAKFDATTRLDLLRHALLHGWMLIGAPPTALAEEHDVEVGADASQAATSGNVSPLPIPLTDGSHAFTSVA